MLLVIDPHSGVPVYRQLMEQIRFHIATGLLGPGDELPPTRALSAQLGINPMTISKAYSFLEKEDVVQRRPGKPLIVRPLKEEQLKEEKIDQLRHGLGPAVRIARQLGISDEEAVESFRTMLLNHSTQEEE